MSRLLGAAIAAFLFAPTPLPTLGPPTKGQNIVWQRDTTSSEYMRMGDDGRLWIDGREVKLDPRQRECVIEAGKALMRMR